ncbi:hypothetical protein [Spongiimicrobium salis]|uniref:hypothetical protein n=1 Tax=Spongiimicrobium salis TaxID=1667022 RepID=UPI00374D52D1
MKKLAILIAFFVITIGCSDDNSVLGSTTPESTLLEFSQNAAIIVSPQSNDLVFVNVEAGERLVFEYFFVAEQEDLIADDEYGERILFEVDPNLSSFSFSDAELATLRPFFNRFCFCETIGSLLISSGTISGTQVNATAWDIDVDLRFDLDGTEVSRSISGRFQLKTP